MNCTLFFQSFFTAHPPTTTDNNTGGNRAFVAQMDGKKRRKLFHQEEERKEEPKKSFVVDFDGKRRKLFHNETYEMKDLGDVEMEDVSSLESNDEFAGPTSSDERTEAPRDDEERGNFSKEEDDDSLAYSEADEEDSLGDDEESLLGLDFVTDDEGIYFEDEDALSLDGEVSIGGLTHESFGSTSDDSWAVEDGSEAGFVLELPRDGAVDLFPTRNPADVPGVVTFTILVERIVLPDDDIEECGLINIDSNRVTEEEEEEARQAVEEVAQDPITLLPSTQRSPRSTLRRSLRLETRGLGSAFTASGRRYSHRLAGTT